MAAAEEEYCTAHKVCEVRKELDRKSGDPAETASIVEHDARRSVISGSDVSMRVYEEPRTTRPTAAQEST